MQQRILIIKLAAIGDVVMALPMIKELRKQNPDSKISWLCGKTVAPLLKEVGGINEIIVIDDARLLTGNLFARLRILVSVWLRLFGRRFDLVLTGHSDRRYRVLSLTVRAKIRRSFTRDGSRFWPVPGRHHTDEYVRLVSGYDGPENLPVSLPILSLPLSDKLRAKLKQNSYSSCIALAPGGAKNTLHEDAIRRWPLENYVMLAEKLIDAGHHVVLTGASSDDVVCNSFAGLPIIDMVGKTNLLELVALYHLCDVVVTPDSGPLHLTGVAGTPLVALFGPTNPYEKVPRNDRTIIFRGGDKLACRPCYDGRAYAECRDNRCLKSISPDDVFRAVCNVLEKAASFKRP